MLRFVFCLSLSFVCHFYVSFFFNVDLFVVWEQHNNTSVPKSGKYWPKDDLESLFMSVPIRKNLSAEEADQGYLFCICICSCS